MSVGVMKDYKLELRDFCFSYTKELFSKNQ